VSKEEEEERVGRTSPTLLLRFAVRSAPDEMSAVMMTLFVLYVLTGVAAVAALLSFAFGPFVLPGHVVTRLSLVFSLLAFGGVVAIALLMLPMVPE
jgi:hypothetical protein